MKALRILAAVCWLSAFDMALADGNSRTFAIWEADGNSYPGTVEKTENGKSFVRFTDGQTAWVPTWGCCEYEVRVGDTVYANYQNRGTYYRAAVTQRDGNNITVQYTDAVVENTTIDAIRIKLKSPYKEVGQPVMARWAPDGYWYPGVIKQITDGKYLITFDDGQQATLEEQYVLGYRPLFEDRVEAIWKGDGRYYKATVSKRDREQVYITFDDGDTEWTTISKLRVNYGATAGSAAL